MNKLDKEILLENQLKMDYKKTILDMEQNIEQKYHWKIQRFIWGCGVIVAVVALVINAYIKTH